VLSYWSGKKPFLPISRKQMKKGLKPMKINFWPALLLAKKAAG
jgi:hypothetical protein